MENDMHQYSENEQGEEDVFGHGGGMSTPEDDAMQRSTQQTTRRRCSGGKGTAACL